MLPEQMFGFAVFILFLNPRLLRGKGYIFSYRRFGLCLGPALSAVFSSSSIELLDQPMANTDNALVFIQASI